MPATQTDRLDGITTSVAVKAPVRVASTGQVNFIGSSPVGYQTIDGVLVTDNVTVANAYPDRVLLKDQADPTQNGIWQASSGAWTRALDFDGPRDAVNGTRVFINEGTANADNEYILIATNPVVIGTSTLIFQLVQGGGSGGRVIWASAFYNALTSDRGLGAADNAAGPNGTVIMDPGAAFVNNGATLTAGKYLPLGGTIDLNSQNLTFTNAPPPDLTTQLFIVRGGEQVKWAGNIVTVHADTFGCKYDEARSYSPDFQAAHDSVKQVLYGGTLTYGGHLRCDTKVVFNCTIGAAAGTKFFELKSRMKGAWLRTNVVGDDGFYFGSTSGGKAPGVRTTGVAFKPYSTNLSVSGENKSANFNYCVGSIHFDIDGFGGFGKLIYFGRAEGVRIFGGNLEGYGPEGSNYITPSLLEVGPDFNNNAGQDIECIGMRFRDARNSTHTGTAVKLTSGGGSEGRFIACQFTNCDIEVDCDQANTTFKSCQLETRGCFLTSSASGSNTGAGTIAPGLLGTGSVIYSATKAIQFPPSDASANIIAGRYTITYTSSTAFNVNDPTTALVGTGTLGTPFNTRINFTPGGTPNNGDVFFIDVESDWTFRLGHAGTPIQGFKADDCQISMSGITNASIFDMQNYDCFQIINNTFTRITGTAVIIGASSTTTKDLQSQITGNRNFVGATNVQDNSTVFGKVLIKDNIDLNNTTPGRVTLTANSATPNIADAPTTVTANASPTTITAFLGGFGGLSFELIVNDANTTITHGTNIFLRAGRTTTFPTGAVLYFRASHSSAIGGSVIWHEVAYASSTSQKEGCKIYNADPGGGTVLTPGTSEKLHILNSALGANRSLSPVATNAIDGITQFEFVVTTAASGSNVWQVKNIAGTVLKTLAAVNDHAKIVYSSDLSDYVLLP